MLKINDYVKIKKGSYPIGSDISVNGFAGKVHAITPIALLIRLDAKSILSLTDELEDDYHYDENDNHIMMFFDAADCIKAKRRDTDEEYEKALSAHWNDNIDSDFQDVGQFDALKTTFSQALSIRAFEQSPFFEHLTPQEKNFHVKIIDIFSVVLFGLCENSPDEIDDADLSEIYNSKSVKVAMTQIIGQKVAYPEEFFTHFTRVASYYIDFLEAVDLLHNGKEVKKELAKQQLKMLAIAKNPKNWDAAKKVQMKMAKAEKGYEPSNSEMLFATLEENGIEFESLLALFGKKE